MRTYGQVELPLEAVELKVKARELLAGAGLTARPVDVAYEMGVDSDFRAWKREQSRTGANPAQAVAQHFPVQGGEAVAVQRGNHVAFTTGMEFGVIRMLCGAAPIPDRTFWDFERRTATPETPTSP